MCYWLFMMFILSMKSKTIWPLRYWSLVTSSLMVWGLVMPRESRLSIMVCDIRSFDFKASFWLERISVSSALRFLSLRAESRRRCCVRSPGCNSSSDWLSSLLYLNPIVGCPPNYRELIPGESGPTPISVYALCELTISYPFLPLLVSSLLGLSFLNLLLFFLLLWSRLE